MIRYHNRQIAHQEIDHIFQDLFPRHGMKARLSQIELSHKMLDAMIHSKIALSDAGTGIGKTYAYLVAGVSFVRALSRENISFQPILTTLNRVVEASNGLQEELAETLRMVCVPGGDGDDLLDLEHELEVLTARQNALLDQALANMADLAIAEQLKTLLEEKQHLQARIDAVKTEAANRISEDSRMAELTAYLEEHLSGFQQYDDGIVRQLVERITVVDAETIRIKFRYSDLEIEQTVC